MYYLEFGYSTIRVIKSIISLHIPHATDKLPITRFYY